MSDKKEKTKENEYEPFCAVDAVLAILYVIIILTGIDVCRTRGLGASNAHLVAVMLSTFGITVVKLCKYIGAGKQKMKEHWTDIVFSAIVFLLAAVAFVTIVLM